MPRFLWCSGNTTPKSGFTDNAVAALGSPLLSPPGVTINGSESFYYIDHGLYSNLYGISPVTGKSCTSSIYTQDIN